MGEEGVEFFPLDGAPGVGLQVIKPYVQYARALELDDRVVHRCDHAAYLMLLAFGKHNHEALWSGLSYHAGLRPIALDVDTRLHRFLEAVANRVQRSHAVFFVVLVFRVEEPIGYAPVVCENEEAARVFVEPADREHVHRDALLHVFLALLRRMRNDADGLVVGKVEMLLRRTFATQLDFVALVYFFSQDGDASVQEHFPTSHDLIGGAARGNALPGEVFIDAHRVLICGFRVRLRHYSPIFLFALTWAKVRI